MSRAHKSIGRQTSLRLGIIGMSEGNGHPYSWSAIFNGFDKEVMASCPFPAIPAYLGRQQYPEDFLDSARVTHVWTQDKLVSSHVAAASGIAHVVERPEDMVGEIDALLLARDDAENHIEFATPFLNAGIPVYVDKPLAVERRRALQLMELANKGNTLYSCSALRYALELQMTPARRKKVGRIRFIDARVPKHWDTYSVHAIEPVLCQFPEADEILEHTVVTANDTRQLTVAWKSGLVTRFTSMGSASSLIEFSVHGETGNVTLSFHDSFKAFRTALKTFVDVVNGACPNISPQFTLKVVDLIELGRRS